MSENRDFKGVWIPKEVWLDERLSALEKVILVEIDSLDKDEKGCWASNQHIAEFCQCSESKVSKSIARLVELGYLTAEKFDGRSRSLKSQIGKNNTPKSDDNLAENARQPSNIYEADSQKMLGSLVKNARQPSKKCQADSQKMPASKTESNTVSKPGSNKYIFIRPTRDEVEAYCKERGNSVDPDQFVDFYDSKGWMVGKTKMKDWKASVRTWERNGFNNTQKPGGRLDWIDDI